MSHHEAPIIQPMVQIEKIAVFPPALETPSPPHPVAPADPEQARAVEAVFEARDQESQKVIGLMGMYTGAMLLHDLAVETFSRPAGELEEEEREKQREN